MTISKDDNSISAYAAFANRFADVGSRLRSDISQSTQDTKTAVGSVADFIAALETYLNQRLGTPTEETERDGDDFIRAQGKNAAIDGGGGNNRIIAYDNAGIRSGSGNDVISAYGNAMIDAGDGDNAVDTYNNASIRAGNGNDNIRAYDNARIAAGGGDDVISVYDNATIWADGGNNRIDAYDNASIQTGDGDDEISVYGNARIETGAGNDQVHAYANASVMLGDGDDRAAAGDNSRLDGGTGNDWLSAGKNAQILGGEGDDQLFGRENALLDGGAGDDQLYAFQNALVQGGSGDDYIDVGANSSILFARGDGNDTLASARDRQWSGNATLLSNNTFMDSLGGLETSTVQFADDIAQEDVKVVLSGDDLVISIADTSDSITVPGGAKDASIPGLAFADGAVWSPEEVAMRASAAI